MINDISSQNSCQQCQVQNTFDIIKGSSDTIMSSTIGTMTKIGRNCEQEVDGWKTSSQLLGTL